MIWLLGLALLVPQQKTETPALVEQLALAQGRHDAGTIQASLLELTDRLGTADLESLQIVVPEIVRAADDPDAQTRGLAMLALTAIKGDGLAVLEPHAGAIARHLHDASLPVRQVTVLVLGTFQRHPTAAVIDPLLESLKEADAPKTIGPGVVYALLTLGVDDPAHPEIGDGILRFVRRPDLPGDVLARVLVAIANAPVHNEALDTGLLGFLGKTHSAPTRSVLVGLLPKLRLAQKTLDGTRAELAGFAADPKEDAGVKAAATGVLPCWHSSRMSDPCPALPMRYRMVAPPKPMTAPRYQSPPLS
ncbi:hypothetical protein [Granulicella sibirica]|uniref:HEAT repeat protein n=1 Tax=Granulicella sibirica TaxID=2479048 RepID=A0A4Q0T039_9BACT|nr:hypothetical protein [Granulicella sibirica]RXH56953.1 hypothetical protein GRAN_0263 [Granulicella sibirica]